jgi:hypothetical protein
MMGFMILFFFYAGKLLYGELFVILNFSEVLWDGNVSFYVFFLGGAGLKKQIQI